MTFKEKRYLEVQLNYSKSFSSERWFLLHSVFDTQSNNH